MSKRHFLFQAKAWHLGMLSALCSMLLIGSEIRAQKNVTTVGIQFKPMIPNRVFSATSTTVSEGTVDFAMRNSFGYAFGMVIRHGFSDTWSVEGGINYVKRNFQLSALDNGSQFQAEGDFGIVGYEMPVLALVYIRLTEQIYMNAAFGASLDFYPSDVAGRYDQFPKSAADSIILRQESRRRSWIQAAGLANLGWEYRTEKNGYFYFGGSFHRPFGAMYTTRMRYSDPAFFSDATTPLNSSYLTLDLRYFFHEDPIKRTKKKKQPNKVKEFKRQIKEREKNEKKNK